MKKLLALAIVLPGFGCNSSSNNDASKDSATEIKPVQNVNGNIPDTTNGAADITGKQKIDTTKIDSSKVKGK